MNTILYIRKIILYHYYIKINTQTVKSKDIKNEFKAVRLIK